MKRLFGLLATTGLTLGLAGCDGGGGGDGALNPGASAKVQGPQLPPGMADMNKKKQAEGFDINQGKPEGAESDAGGPPGLPPR